MRKAAQADRAKPHFEPQSEQNQEVKSANRHLSNMCATIPDALEPARVPHEDFQEQHPGEANP